MVSDEPLLHKFDVFGHDVIAFGAVTRQLERLVAQEDIGAFFDQINEDIELCGMSS